MGMICSWYVGMGKASQNLKIPMVNQVYLHWENDTFYTVSCKFNVESMYAPLGLQWNICMLSETNPLRTFSTFISSLN